MGRLLSYSADQSNVCPLITKGRCKMLTVKRGLTKDSVILLEQIRTIDKQRLNYPNRCHA